MDWVDLVLRLGLPSASLVAIGLFVARRIWPFIENAYLAQQEERAEEREKFLAALVAQREQFNQAMIAERTIRLNERDRFLDALEKHRYELQSVAATLREVQHALEKANGGREGNRA